MSSRCSSATGRTTDTLVLSGNIEAHESVVAFKSVQSRIVELPFDEGQWVEAGTLLARLDASDYRQQVAIDEAALRTRRAAARLGRAGVRGRAQYGARRRGRPGAADTRREAGYDALAARASYRVTSSTGWKPPSSSPTRSSSATARSTPPGLATSRSLARTCGAAREQLRLARILLGYTVLRAPFAGVILVRQAELGEVMLPGTPVVTLADLDHVWLRAYVQRDRPRPRPLGPGRRSIRTDTYPDRRYPGRISFISSKAEFTPKSVETHAERVTLVYRIQIDVENPAHELKPGMPADATIDLGVAGTDG